jgi:glucose-1-phosphate adenylyltransferase
VVRKDPNIGLATRLTKVIVDRGVRIPEGLVGGEDPSLDVQRFRRTDEGVCLITQRMIDELIS